jgi:AbrB family transcriptional regulator, transcriptional pleiotropic regulator of transition state genes
MRTRGMVRKIDDLGRIVLPSELRKVLNMTHGDELAISVDGDMIILEKRQNVCVFCSADSPSVEFRGQCLCGDCARELGSSAGGEIRLTEEAHETT